MVTVGAVFALQILLQPTLQSLSVSHGELVDESGHRVALRGVCFSNWLAEKVPHSDADVRAVASMGANCIEITVPFRLLDSGQGGLRDDGVAQIDRMLGYCRAVGTYAIITCTAPESERTLASDRATRVRFVETWVRLCGRYAAGDNANASLVAIIPFEQPSRTLMDQRQYGDLCSYLATELRKAAPGLLLFLAPLQGPGPEGAPMISYANVGAVCRADAAAEQAQRDRTIEAAAMWAAQSGKPVLADRVAPPAGLATEERDSRLKATLASLLGASPVISFLYDEYACASGPDGIGIRFAQDGKLVRDEGLQALLSAGFRGKLAVPPPQNLPGAGGMPAETLAPES